MPSAWGQSWGSAWGASWGAITATIAPATVAAPLYTTRDLIPPARGVKMSISVVHIWNLALSHVGQSDEVQDVNENTAAANACRRYYDPTREEVLSDFAWPFATVTESLGLVANNPTTEWLYSYRYPGDALVLRRILGSDRNPGRQARVPYRIQRDGQGQLIFTDWPNAVAEYTQAVSDTTAFSSQFAQAVAFLLAAYIAPRVTGGDPYNLGARALKMYQWAVYRAQATAANEEQVDDAPDSEFTNAR